MLIVPNLLWAKNQPAGYETYTANENKLLSVLERIGEVLVVCTALIFTDFNPRWEFPWILWLLAAFALMIIYELYWLRYFRSQKSMNDFYCSFLGIPLAGATLPVCAFFMLGIYGENLLMIAAAVVLGIGHIGIHFNHRKELSY